MDEEQLSETKLAMDHLDLRQWKGILGITLPTVRSTIKYKPMITAISTQLICLTI